jgi:hypothetical protein
MNPAQAFHSCELSVPAMTPQGNAFALPAGAVWRRPIEAVRIPAAFTFCEGIVAARGTIAKVGVRGIMVDALLEKAVVAKRAITTRRIDTSSTPMLLKRSHAMSNRSKIGTQQCR